MTRSNPIRLALGALGVLALAAGPLVAQEVPCGESKPIQRLGGANRFSEPIESQEQLRALFENSRDEIIATLRQAGFEGDPSDLFQAVASGNAVRSYSFPVGQKMDWMFSRKKGKAEVLRDVCWAGKEAFQGWEVHFTSGDQWYAMVVPEACGNLSFLTGTQTAVPNCSLDVSDPAGRTCNDTTFEINGAGTTAENATVTVRTPSGASRKLPPSSDMRWTFDSDEPKGTFTFTIEGSTKTPRGTTLTCQAERRVERDCCVATEPTIRISAANTSLQPGEETTVTVDPSVSECTELDSVTVDGQALSAPYEMTFSNTEPGDYTITAQVKDQLGQMASASVGLTVLQPPATGRKGLLEGNGGGWTLRPFLTAVTTDDDQQRADLDNGERRRYATSSGYGLGLEAEYRFNRPVFGLALGAIVAEPDIFLELDFGSDWGMADEALSMTTLFVGPTFHLTNGNRADLFVGPLLAWVDYGSANWDLIGRHVSNSFGDEITWGAQLGLDVPFKKDGNKGLYLGAMYLDSDLETDVPGAGLAEDELELGISPFMFNVGLFFDLF